VFGKYDLTIMSLELITIVPHGTILIKELRYGLENNTLKTIQGLNVIRHLIKDKRLDHLFVLDPHSRILSSKISIVTLLMIIEGLFYLLKRNIIYCRNKFKLTGIFPLILTSNFKFKIMEVN
jgi:aromatic ring-opening dioxygenase LigB subunit